MIGSPAVFSAPDEQLVADTCEPLRDASEAGDVELHAWVHGHYPGRELPADVLGEIATVGSWNATRAQAWGLDWHYNEGIEFTFLESGRLGFACGEFDDDLESGALTITGPWQRHRVGRPAVGASKLGWLLLDVGVRYPNQDWRWPDWLVCSPDDLDAVERMVRRSAQPVWRAHEDVRTAFHRMMEITEAPYSSRLALRLKLHVNTLLVAVLEMLEREQPIREDDRSDSRRSVAVFLDRLPERLDETWSVERMADECGLRRSRFTHYCRQETNMSPGRYLLAQRVARARDLLTAAPELTITEIAFAVGFSSSQHLATAFRAQVGLTPREFRAAHRS